MFESVTFTMYVFYYISKYLIRDYVHCCTDNVFLVNNLDYKHPKGMLELISHVI